MITSLPDLLRHGWVWLLVILGPLLFFQRRLQLELQAVLYLLTRRQDMALKIFALLLLPGVFLHEASHWLAARILGVRTGRVSLTPQVLPGGTLRLGFVTMAQVDVFREALIGSAPLVMGGAVMAYVGIAHLQAIEFGQSLAAGALGQFFLRLVGLPAQPDFWLWIYVVFAVSTTMFPSPSDRRAWLPVLLVMGTLVGVAVLAGAGPWLLGHLGPPIDRFAGAMASVFGVCVLVQAGLTLLLWVFRKVLSRVFGLQLV